LSNSEACVCSIQAIIEAVKGLNCKRFCPGESDLKSNPLVWLSHVSAAVGPVGGGTGCCNIGEDVISVVDSKSTMDLNSRVS